ncbi:FAD-dependent monooxygenase [Saccharopolyspora taberi]|uniref:FAD-dependent monooxygenase n=1 Tax=Saccharopolyspora taberi TaxID=60895 RepID=A0ABN3VEU2_9PSEU
MGSFPRAVTPGDQARELDAEVIVVGAGPVGLMLAGELRLAGAEVVVLDRLPEPTTESRGLGFTARTAELFAQRGLLSRFESAEASPKGHFGGIPLDYSVLEGSHFGVRNVEQSQTEAVLGGWAAELGADIRRGLEVTGVEDLGDLVEVAVTGSAGPQRLRAAYLVGADGGRSTVRALAGFDFVGTPATCEMFLADVRGCDLRARFIGEKVAGGMVMAARLHDDVDRIIVCERGTPPRRRTGPPSFAEVAGAWQRLTGEDISGATALWVSSFSDATGQATRYRRGRVLLAGDAAHIHLPAGGQGLSVGVQDAVNLGWKLGAEVTGTAPPGLLDSYHDERHPVGARVLLNTQAQGLLYLSGSEVEPLRERMTALMRLDSVGRHLSGMVSGFDVRYDVGEGDHPLLGMRLPDQQIRTASGPARTLELLRRGRGLLLDLADDAGLRGEITGHDLEVVTATAPEGTPLAGTTAALVRPDGYLAWAAPGGADPAAALERWFANRSPALAG